MTKLTIDLILGWFQQTVRDLRFWLTSVLLALPICVLAQIFFIQKAYLDPTFTGIENTNLIRNAVSHQDGKYQAIEHYIAEEIIEHWPASVAYERTKWLDAKIDSVKILTEVSFFSGGYESLGIKPLLGSLESMEFPSIGTQMTLAISNEFWGRRFNWSKNIIGQTIIISGKAIKIVAVMPTSFQSFKRNRKTDLIIPFEYISELNLGDSQEILPDTQSYIIAESVVLDIIEKTASHYFKEQALLFDESEIILNEAIGVDSLEFITVSKRIYLLTMLFLCLLFFCLIAFVTYFVGLLTRKQKEYFVRRLCGANTQHLFWQELLDVLLTVLFILSCCTLLFQFVSELVRVFLPQVEADYFIFPWKIFAQIMFVSFILLSIIIGAFSFIQYNFVTSHVGRGQSASLAQKLQSYFLSVLLVCVSSFALFMAFSILQHQYTLNEKNLGFQLEQRFITNFEFPRGQTGTFYANNLPQLLLQNLASSPTIISAALTNIPPFLNKTSYTQFYTPSLEPIGSGQSGNVLFDYVSPNYFDVLGQKLIKGKKLEWGNYWQVLVNRTLWDRYLSQYSLTEAKLIKYDTSGEKFALDVVGVVEDAYLHGRDRVPQPIVYRVAVTITGYESLIVRSSQTPLEIEKTLNNSISEIDVNFGEFKLESLELLGVTENAPRKAILAVSVYGSVLMFLSTLIYTFSSITQLVNKSAREIAIRTILGARLLSLVLNEFKLFLIILLPMSLLTYLLARNFGGTLVNFEVANASLDTAYIFIPCLLLSIFVFFIFVWLISRKLQTAWTNLT